MAWLERHSFCFQVSPTTIGLRSRVFLCGLAALHSNRLDTSRRLDLLRSAWTVLQFKGAQFIIGSEKCAPASCRQGQLPPKRPAKWWWLACKQASSFHDWPFLPPPRDTLWNLIELCKCPHGAEFGVHSLRSIFQHYTAFVGRRQRWRLTANPFEYLRVCFRAGVLLVSSGLLRTRAGHKCQLPCGVRNRNGQPKQKQKQKQQQQQQRQPVGHFDNSFLFQIPRAQVVAAVHHLHAPSSRHTVAGGPAQAIVTCVEASEPTSEQQPERESPA